MGAWRCPGAERRCFGPWMAVIRVLLNGLGLAYRRRCAIFKYQGWPTPQPAPLVLTVAAVAPLVVGNRSMQVARRDLSAT